MCAFWKPGIDGAINCGGPEIGLDDVSSGMGALKYAYGSLLQGKGSFFGLGGVKLTEPPCEGRLYASSSCLLQTSPCWQLPSRLVNAQDVGVIVPESELLPDSNSLRL